MRRAEPHELNAKVVPVLAATLSKKDFVRLFPVRFDEMDPFSEPEPSEGALVRLESGPLAVVAWGRSTGNLTVSVSEKADRREAIRAILREVGFPIGTITWRADETAPALVGRPRARAVPRAAKKAMKKAAPAHRHAPRRKR